MDSTVTLKQSKKTPQGFTLIELIVVIVILGILAATVAPKYIDITSDAHTATLKAVKGSLEGASALVYSKSIVAGNQNIHRNDSPTVVLSDGPLNIHYGYPKANVADWKRLIEVDENVYSMLIAGDGSLIIYRSDREGAPPTRIVFDCIAYYRQGGENRKAVAGVNPCI
tara:strand:- start:1061 stop:1567 length:507 start_codon:yes stop_codon:yes gene_type:complete